MKAITYKFRAECLHDVIVFMEKARLNPIDIKIKTTLAPDIIVELKTAEPLSKLMTAFNKVPDSHVMRETIQPKKLYTGIRKVNE